VAACYLHAEMHDPPLATAREDTTGAQAAGSRIPTHITTPLHARTGAAPDLAWLAARDRALSGPDDHAARAAAADGEPVPGGPQAAVHDRRPRIAALRRQPGPRRRQEEGSARVHSVPERCRARRASRGLRETKNDELRVLALLGKALDTPRATCSMAVSWTARSSLTGAFSPQGQPARQRPPLRAGCRLLTGRTRRRATAHPREP
jgi:hypothetical protein